MINFLINCYMFLSFPIGFLVDYLVDNRYISHYGETCLLLGYMLLSIRVFEYQTKVKQR